MQYQRGAILNNSQTNRRALFSPPFYQNTRKPDQILNIWRFSKNPLHCGNRSGITSRRLKCSQGGAKLPTGGKGARSAQARERPAFCRGQADFGEIPKPTVQGALTNKSEARSTHLKVRMKRERKQAFVDVRCTLTVVRFVP